MDQEQVFKMKTHIRKASIKDSQIGSHLILLTLNRFGDYLFGFGDHLRAYAVLRRFFLLRGNRFSFQHVYFMEMNSEITGLLVYFNRTQIVRSWMITALQIFKVYQLADIGKFLKRMLPYKNEEIIGSNELYIAHLAVVQNYRRRGIGQQLLEFAQQKAEKLNYHKISLLTEIENTPAISLYKKFGFLETKRILHPEQKEYIDSIGDIHMEKSIE